MTQPPSYVPNISWPYAGETAYLRSRRATYGLDASALPTPGAEGSNPQMAHGTVGLALSGGGIRSATFSLGVLQALARVDVLEHVDYLSTVSGGGYVGSCVTSLLSADSAAGVRPATQPARAFPLGFSGADCERAEIRHLRDYSNYISPRHGPFKLETWRVVSWYLAALLVNLACALVVAAAVLMLATRLVLWLWDEPLGGMSALIWIALGLVIAFVVIAGVLFVAGSKRVRDSMNVVLAYATACLAGAIFLVVAPRAYEELIRATALVQPLSIQALDRGLHVYGLCVAGASCDPVAGPVAQIRPALHFAGARLVDAPTSERQLTAALREAGAAIATTEQGPTFRASNDQLLAALSAVGFHIGDGGDRLGGLLNAVFGLLIGLIPPAVLGIGKRSFRVFLAATAGLVVAITATHVLWLVYESWGSDPWLYLLLLVAAGMLGLININRVSILNLYRDRLADCYIVKRDASPPVVTQDGLLLHAILPAANGPYQLINGTLNLSGSNDLSLRGRMAAPFVFSKLYCGSPRIGYRATKNYDGGRFDLATAMAISGAAVSPQSGEGTRPGLAVLLSLLNLRLGQWVLNPREKAGWPVTWWNAYFMKELFSLADENDKYVLVSDGGHFDNTGIYALLQRRCRLIIAVDAGCDRARRFDDLAGIIRKARIDFGIAIDIDLRPLHAASEDGRARRGYAAGTIEYPNDGKDPGGTGQLVCIKPTLDVAKSESEDIREYAAAHPAFPHESTTDQFFDEAQFESYRELGYTITRAAFG